MKNFLCTENSIIKWGWAVQHEMPVQPEHTINENQMARQRRSRFIAVEFIFGMLSDFCYSGNLSSYMINNSP